MKTLDAQTVDACLTHVFEALEKLNTSDPETVKLIALTLINCVREDIKRLAE